MRIQIEEFGDLFVGRKQELTRLKVALQKMISGGPTVLSVSGEPGIGKTKLLENFIGSTSRPVNVLRGRCTQGEGAPPYYPWMQIVGSFVESCSESELIDVLGDLAPVVAEVVDEIGTVLGNVGEPIKLQDPNSGRFRFNQSIVTLFKRASSIRPIMIVMEDIQWADSTSLGLLSHLVLEMRTEPIMTILSHRHFRTGSENVLRGTLADFVRSPRYERIELRGLRKEEISEYLYLGTGLAPTSEIVGTFLRATAGNPLFVRELSRMFDVQGFFENPANIVRARNRVPATLQDLFHGWLVEFPTDCLAILTTAAIIGTEVPVEKLLFCLEIPREQMMKKLEEAFEARLFLTGSGRYGNYRFCHAMMRQAILAELGSTELAELHGRVGNRLEQYHGSKASDHAEELAYHYRRAVNILGIEKYLQYAELAGEQAISKNAFEHAEVTFLQALSIERDSQNDEQRGSLFFGLGRARIALNQREKAVEALTQAFELFVRAGKTERALAAAQFPFVASFRDSGETKLCMRALELTSVNSLEAGRLQCQLSLALALEGRNYSDAGSAYDKALLIGQKHGDGMLETRALLVGAFIDREQLFLEKSLEKSRRALELCSEITDPLRSVASHHMAQEAMFAMGDFKQGEKNAAQELRVAEMMQDRFWLVLAYASNQRYRICKGDWDTARSLNDEGLKLNPKDPFLLINRARLEYETGNPGIGERYLSRYCDGLHVDAKRTWGARDRQYASVALVIPLISRITGDTEFLNLAETSAQSIFDFPRYSPEWRYRAAACLGLISVALDNGDEAANRYTILESMIRDGPISQFRFCRGSMTYVEEQLGMISLTAGDFDRAITHFDKALEETRSGGNNPEFAWCCYDLARALHERGNLEDQKRAIDLLEEGTREAESLGMSPLVKHFFSLQHVLSSRSTLPNGLTKKEAEVLHLLAKGKSNKEIASELFIAERTAANHVSNIFKKIRCENRVEATRFALRHGIG